MNSMRHLVLGAARSGKTRFALNMAKSLTRARENDVIYVATAEAHDAEMRERIARHREERPEEWRTLEAPRDLAKALTSTEVLARASTGASGREARTLGTQPSEAPTLSTDSRAARADSASVIVIDCLTLWLSNALLTDFNENNATAALPTWSRERESFMRWLSECPHTVILVSNEVGGGIVPTSALARRFQSEQGWLNQDVASVCEQVTLVVAGLPLTLKPR